MEHGILPLEASLSEPRTEHPGDVRCTESTKSRPSPYLSPGLSTPSSKSAASGSLSSIKGAPALLSGNDVDALGFARELCGLPVKTEMKRVIELIRVSTERQAAKDRASIPAQRAANRRTCLHQGLEIIRSFDIADVSGASVLLAPEMQELFRTINSPIISGVVAREFSRLMRPENFDDYALLQAFVDSRTILYLPEGPIDFASKTGRLMGTIRAAIAGMERTEILERVWSAKEEKRRRGELAQSSIVLPFGVGYEQGRGFYYKPEAERVRAAFRQFLAGETTLNSPEWSA